MLIAVTTETQAVSVQYLYIPDGRQVRQIANGTTTNYFHDQYNPLAEYDSAAQREVRYTYNLIVDDVVFATRGDSTSWYHKDALGSVMALTDASETVTAEYRYDPFGGIVWRSGSLDNNITYTGRRYDAESGLYYYRGRNYCANNGRFIQIDGYSGEQNSSISLNRYIYCFNDPTCYTDPFGNKPLLIKLFDFSVYHPVWCVGVSITVEGEYESEDCCNDDGKLIEDGDRKLTVTSTLILGLGWGATTQVLGIGVDHSLTGPGFIVEDQQVFHKNDCTGELSLSHYWRPGGVHAAFDVGLSALGVFSGTASLGVNLEFELGYTVSAEKVHVQAGLYVDVMLLKWSAYVATIGTSGSVVPPPPGMSFTQHVPIMEKTWFW